MHVARQFQTTLSRFQLVVASVLKIRFAFGSWVWQEWQTNFAKKLQRRRDWLVIGCRTSKNRARLGRSNDQFVGRIHFLVVRSYRKEKPSLPQLLRIEWTR